ncbi:SMI1/KNR4 family protein [uncultured Maribacter sp.]|uniref:SMI1/KNR4 family protein n=1 Tax=uncultured Maribacter sp. TaxID=431308 RepID=UPI00262DB506|nr:SMI1/KNR4 family protein [uncultured Maribacter sp.]
MDYLEYAKQQQEIDSDLEIFGGINEDFIKKSEDKLGVLFPKQYALFLKECGSCGYPDSYISGLFQEWNNEESPGSTLYDTLMARKQHNLSKDYIVLEYAVDENYYLLKVSEGITTEDSAIYSVDIDSDENLGRFNKIFDSFEEYFKFTIKAEN